MDSQKLTNLSTFNALNMYEFELLRFVADDNSLVIRAHQGYPQHFWAEIEFSWVGYITCPVNFFDVRLRLATEQEIARLGPHKNASLVYCFEDTLAPDEQKASSFFISANSIEIIVYYDGDNLSEIIERAGNEALEQLTG